MPVAQSEDGISLLGDGAAMAPLRDHYVTMVVIVTYHVTSLGTVHILLRRNGCHCNLLYVSSFTRYSCVKFLTERS